MGMIFTLVFLLLKLSSVVHFEAYYLLPVLLMLSRLNAVFAIYFYEYVSGGVGALIKSELAFKHLISALAFSLLLAYSFSFLLGLLVAFFTLLATGRFFTSRLGGLSGDIYGFLIEITELFLLNYIIITNFS